jgi:hypothetical protein
MLLRVVKQSLLEIWLSKLTKKIRTNVSTTETLIPRSHYYSNEKLGKSIIDVTSNYLKTSGWIESKVNNASYFQGQYFPWITFPAIDFLEKLSLENSVIVEFGAGASTCYFGKKAKAVVSYEFDSKYFSQIEGLAKEFTNVEILNFDPLKVSEELKNISPLMEATDDELEACVSFDEKFCDISMRRVLGGGFYDIASTSISNGDLIFIDGGPRNTALLLASRFAKTNAIVVVDNSDQDYVEVGIRYLINAGFQEIPFSGLGPLNPYKFQTSFFVKNLGSIASKYSKGIS